MACPGGYYAQEAVGVTFCQGSCGTGKNLKWQKYRYLYASGTSCTADVYISCC